MKDRVYAKNGVPKLPVGKENRVHLDIFFDHPDTYETMISPLKNACTPFKNLKQSLLSLESVTVLFRSCAAA
jgi:hypothetical protein